MGLEVSNGEPRRYISMFWFSNVSVCFFSIQALKRTITTARFAPCRISKAIARDSGSIWSGPKKCQVYLPLACTAIRVKCPSRIQVRSEDAFPQTNITWSLRRQSLEAVASIYFLFLVPHSFLLPKLHSYSPFRYYKNDERPCVPGIGVRRRSTYLMKDIFLIDDHSTREQPSKRLPKCSEM